MPLWACSFGLVGEGIFIAEYQQEFSIFAGLLMILMGLFSLLHLRVKGLGNPLLKGFSLLKNALGKQLSKKPSQARSLLVFSMGFYLVDLSILPYLERWLWAIGGEV